MCTSKNYSISAFFSAVSGYGFWYNRSKYRWRYKKRTAIFGESGCILRVKFHVMAAESTHDKPSKFLIVVSLLGVVFLSIHFVLTFIFSTRDFMPMKSRVIAESYSFPAFHQDWKLFAPDLAMYNVDIEYRYAISGKWSGWIDVGQSHGYGEYSRLERIEQGFGRLLVWEATNNFYSKNGERQFDRIMRSSAYRNALYFTMKMHESGHENTSFDSLQIRLNFRFTPKPENFKKGAEQVFLEFPNYVNQPSPAR